jgi:bifunctional non-homologous end joining protein LigD
MLSLDELRPTLLSERRAAPADETGWVAELKLDGYRVLARFGDRQCQLRTRKGVDCTLWFPEVSRALAELHCGVMITDGEMCVLDDLGRADFDALHARAMRRRFSQGDPPITYCMFDLLVDRGRDIVRLPLYERKARLARLLAAQRPPHTLYVQHVSEDDVPRPVTWLYAQALALQQEGVVGKRAGSPYRAGLRTDDWFKLKRPGATPRGRFARGER